MGCTNNVDGKTIALGVSHDKEDVIKLRKQAEKLYNYHENHGRII